MPNTVTGPIGCTEDSLPKIPDAQAMVDLIRQEKLSPRMGLFVTFWFSTIPFLFFKA
jgi:hypothetical protein